MKYFGLQFAFACLLGSFMVGPAGADPSREPSVVPQTTEAWHKPYETLDRLVRNYMGKVERKYYPEFMMIRGSDIIATMQIDPFGAQVLKEAKDLWLPYRKGLQECIDRSQNEYRGTHSWSFEKFAWFLDDYTRLVVDSIGEYEEPPMRGGMREKRVSTDRKIYAYTQLATAYLNRKIRHQKGKDAAAERAMEASLQDIAKRVFRLDMTQPFNPEALKDKDWSSQPVFRHLAGDADRAELKLALDPLYSLDDKASQDEPRCAISLPGRKVARQ